MSQFFVIHPENPQARLIREAAKIIRDGGVVVYPTDSCYALGCHLGDKKAIERLILDFKAAGGEALEIASGSHSLDDMIKFALHAQRHGLYASAGSDFHAPGEGGRDVGSTQPLPPICQPVWQALAHRVLQPAANPAANLAS